ncbi:transporter substrate-binding domain-containing protein [Amycolatopsis sp. FU40]|uniref:transporter substrate-binding domain-containing protein n=1 Tax=Amycolatopsis sp. FU40 TaxID=2914159 RepID=UPI001F18C634|nr:transporter substrate-binding domain-containing protein [Amycolatopsis sp. FU40]UKD57077.1 transporter substrate-binding domain-containing protein [Amycolatopsis sp. FU40]
MKRLLQTSATAASLALLLGACGSSGASGGATAADPGSYGGADPALVKLVPADIHAKGTLAGGASFDTRPMNFYSPGNKPDGVLLDLINAASAKLGLTVKWAQVPYAGLIPALQSKRVEIAGAQITKTPENKGVVNLLAFYKASSSLLVSQGRVYHSETDACGTRFGLTSGSTINQNIANSINAKCKAAGKPALQYLYFPSFNAGQDAVRSGRVDSMVNSAPQIQLATKADKTLGATLVGQLAARETGIALPKDYGALTQAFKAAFNAMITDGTYKKILDKWDLASMAVAKAETNDEIPMS